jgi:hypothetical protein
MRRIALVIALLALAFTAGLFPGELLAAGEAVVRHVHEAFFVRFFDAGAFGFICA